MALARAINPTYHAKPWNFFTHSGPALIAHAVKEHGWSFIPNHSKFVIIVMMALNFIILTLVVPPLVANSA
jgi:hypothetical protein